MVDRSRDDPNADPLEPLRDALEHGFSLIIFPEGTRSAQPLPGPFKSGLYHLSQEFPQVELIPVYIENLHRSMPKGAFASGADHLHRALRRRAVAHRRRRQGCIP